MFTVTVTRSAGTTGVVGCSIAATSTTTESDDYDIDMGPLRFSEGQNTTQFNVRITNDAIPELEEVSDVVHFGVLVTCWLSTRLLRYPSLNQPEELEWVTMEHLLSLYSEMMTSMECSLLH